MCVHEFIDAGHAAIAWCSLLMTTSLTHAHPTTTLGEGTLDMIVVSKQHASRLWLLGAAHICVAYVMHDGLDVASHRC